MLVLLMSSPGQDVSGNTHTWEEGNHTVVVRLEEPLIVLLEDTLSRNTMLLKNSIQTWFGSVRLPTTIEQFDPSFTNASNQIAVQIDIRNVRTWNDLSVIEFPIFACSDSSIHQSFDLTHGRDLRRFESCGGWVVSLPSDALNIGHLAGEVKCFRISVAYGGDQVFWWSGILTFVGFRGIVGLTYINSAHLQEITNTYPIFFKVFLFPQVFPQN